MKFYKINMQHLKSLRFNLYSFNFKGLNNYHAFVFCVSRACKPWARLRDLGPIYIKICKSPVLLLGKNAKSGIRITLCKES